MKAIQVPLYEKTIKAEPVCQSSDRIMNKMEKANAKS